MIIKDVFTSSGLTGFYFDDQKAIKQGAKHDGFTYVGEPATQGFSNVRQKGESISVMLLLEDGQIAYGDCIAVQYSGVGGRDPLFLAKEYVAVIEKEVKPRLIGRKLSSFKELAEEFDGFIRENGKQLHTAIRYGITQAILDAVAKAKHQTMAEVIAEEYNLPLEALPVPIFAQTGDDRYLNADKCILKGVEVFPHGLINNVEEKLGSNGELLKEYVAWLTNRIKEIGSKGYRPALHIDVYGTLGIAFKDDEKKMAEFLHSLAKLAEPYKLRIEGPMDAGSKDGQIKALLALHKHLKAKNSPVEIVADEWCNTLDDIKEFAKAGACGMIQIKTPDLGGINNSIEAVLYCKQHGVAAYLGGTCNGTERSAQVCVHIALATRPAQMLAKPGMGVDEGVMIVSNEMNRTLAILKSKLSK